MRNSNEARKRFHLDPGHKHVVEEPKQSKFILGSKTRLFTTRKAAAEFLSRATLGDWSTRAACTDNPRLAAMVASHKLVPCKTSPLGFRRVPVNGLRMAECGSDGIIMGGIRFAPADPNDGTTVLPKAKPRKSSPTGGAGVRVYPINGIWRRALINADGSRSFVADYGSMNDALACTNPIVDHSGVSNKAHVVVQSEKVWAGG